MPVLTSINVTYNVAEYSAVLEWYSPRDDRPETTNYTIILQDKHALLYSETVNKDVQNHSFHLKYSTNYSVTLYATNCKGSGNSTFFVMFEGTTPNSTKSI